jgi:hypothetical protein
VGTRRLIITVLGLIGAVSIGWYIADGSLLWPAVAAAVFGLWIVSHALNVRADALVTGLVLIGYLVGNRGFAQLSVPSIPLLPGEISLALGFFLTMWQAARTQSLPFRRDGLNFLVLIWITFGLARIPLDFREHGFVAVRDFAITYYAVFFFLAQAWAGLPRENRWVYGCLCIGLALCAPVYYVFLLQPEIFTNWLSVSGVPLVYVKSDVAAGFMASAVFWFGSHASRTGELRWYPLSAFAMFGVVFSNSRAAVIAVIAGCCWLVILRVWAPIRVFCAMLVIALCGLAVQAVATDKPFPTTPLYRLFESAASIVDYRSARTYQVADLSDKPDNNQFRLVWWRAVIDETWANGRWLGLGYGHDLAGEFLRIYYADANEEFTARSPHNFLLSIFGRTGLLGFSAFMMVMTAVAVRTWRVGRRVVQVDADSRTLYLWLTAWMILASACFGVVLEGPMGAIVFWTSLGLANGRTFAPTAREMDVWAIPAPKLLPNS